MSVEVKVHNMTISIGDNSLMDRNQGSSEGVRVAAVPERGGLVVLRHSNPASIAGNMSTNRYRDSNLYLLASGFPLGMGVKVEIEEKVQISLHSNLANSVDNTMTHRGRDRFAVVLTEVVLVGGLLKGEKVDVRHSTMGYTLGNSCQDSMGRTYGRGTRAALGGEVQQWLGHST